MLIRRLARPMLATMFIAGGVDTLRNPGGRPHAAAPLIAKGEQILPDRITDNIPTNPDTLVKINAAVQLGGGLLLASGHLPRMASLALAGSLVPTTVAGHAFWEETDPAVKSAQRIHFLKNVSLLGGLLIAAVDTEGKPSLGWRSRRATKRANRVVAVALPFAASRASSTSDTLGGVASRAAERGHEVAQRIAASDTTRQLSVSRSELAHAARARASHLSAVAAERGTELAHAAAQRGGELAQIATDRGPVLAAQVRDL
ncbi:MAG: DoxX family protein, partial [Mycobacteriaceae bacterium]